PASVVEIADDVAVARPGADGRRLRELVALEGKTSELVESGGAPLLVEQEPAVVRAGESLEESFGRVVIAAVRLRREDPHLPLAVAELDFAAGQRADAA